MLFGSPLGTEPHFDGRTVTTARGADFTSDPSRSGSLDLRTVALCPPGIQSMSGKSPSDETITTAAEFRRALSELMAETLENGFDPRGAWEYHARDGEMSVEVQIHELSD